MSSVNSRQRSQALLMLLVANIFWGLSFPLIKAIALTHLILIPESGNWFVTAFTVGPRFILGGLVLFVWQRRAAPAITPGEWRQGIALGFFAGFGMLFQTDGLQFTAASTSAFLTQFYAISIPIYLAIRARRLPQWTVWVSSILVLAGVAVLSRLNLYDLRIGRGEIETLIASLFFMGQILTLDRKSYAGNRVLPVTLVMFLIQAGLCIVLGIATAPTHPNILGTLGSSVPWLAYTVVLTVLSTLGAYLIMNTYQPKITAVEAGLIYCAEPVFGSLLALFLPAVFSAWAGIVYENEIFTTNLLIGGGLITAANVLIQLRPPPKE